MSKSKQRETMVYCFACKEQRSVANIKRRGKTKNGKTWNLCVWCSERYKERIHSGEIKRPRRTVLWGPPEIHKYPFYAKINGKWVYVTKTHIVH